MKVALAFPGCHRRGVVELYNPLLCGKIARGWFGAVWTRFFVYSLSLLDTHALPHPGLQRFRHLRWH